MKEVFSLADGTTVAALVLAGCTPGSGASGAGNGWTRLCPRN